MSLLIGAHMGIPGYGREGKESVGEQDLRRYANFGDKSVELICESSGYPEVHPEAHKLLAEDLSFRLRDLTHTCSQFLRHGKRRKLTPRDVDLALRAKKFDRLLGYSSKEPTHFQYVRDAEVFIANDREVEVGDLALDNLPFYHHGRSYVTMRTIHHSWRTDPYANGLSPNELICYKRIARATVEGGAEFPILARFARNTRVFQSNLIISSILTLVQRLVVDLCHDGYVLGRVLCLLDSFVSNKTTELLVNYYEVILDCVLFCLLEPNLCGSTSAMTHLTVRDRAAVLTAKLLSGTAKCVRVAREDTASRIITTISESLEHSTLYGAFAGAIALRLPMDATLVVVQQATPIDGSFWDWQHMNFKLLCWIAMAYRFSFKHAVAELNSPLPSMKCPHVLALHAMRSVFEWQIEPMLCQLPYSPYLNPILEEQILNWRTESRRWKVDYINKDFNLARLFRIFHPEFSLRRRKKINPYEPSPPSVTPLVFDKLRVPKQSRNSPIRLNVGKQIPVRRRRTDEQISFGYLENGSYRNPNEMGPVVIQSIFSYAECKGETCSWYMTGEITSLSKRTLRLQRHTSASLHLAL